MSYTTSANFGSPRGSVKSLKSVIPLLSRQRPQVRVPSSPPFIPKQLGDFHSTIQGTKRAHFAPFLCPFLATRSFLSGNPSILIGQIFLW